LLFVFGVKKKSPVPGDASLFVFIKYRRSLL